MRNVSPKKQVANKNTIPAVAKALDVVRLLATEKRDETTTKALAMRLGVPRTTCYRILRSLIAKDWVQPTANGYHVLSLGLLPLLEPFRRMEHLAELVQPTLSAVAMRAEMTTKMSVRQGDYAVTIARGRSPQPTSVGLPLGGTFHLAYGASGAVLLSQLESDEVSKILKRAPEECWAYQNPQDVLERVKEFQSKGWCADFGKFNPSINTVSVPLKRRRRDILAALTLIGFPQDFHRERLPGLVTMALEAAKQAEKDLQVFGVAEPHSGPLSTQGGASKRPLR